MLSDLCAGPLFLRVSVALRRRRGFGALRIFCRNGKEGGFVVASLKVDGAESPSTGVAFVLGKRTAGRRSLLNERP